MSKEGYQSDANKVAVVGSDSVHELSIYIWGEETDNANSQNEEKNIPPTLATYSNYHLSAQQYTWHLSVLLFAISLHDQH